MPISEAFIGNPVRPSGENPNPRRVEVYRKNVGVERKYVAKSS